jgi:hypothetical protein
MRILILGMLAIVLSGCVTDREEAWLLSNYYSRSDVDAINAETVCRQLARNLLQAQRCGVRR